MKTMQEVQALIRNLREIYTDVRLLDEATVERIQEGKRTDPLRRRSLLCLPPQGTHLPALYGQAGLAHPH